MNVFSTGKWPAAEIWTALKPKRRPQFFILAFFMICGAVAEFMTLGTLAPFIMLMSDPETVLADSRYAFTLTLADAIGVSNLRLFVTMLFCSLIVFAAVIRLGLHWLSARYSMMIGFDFSRQAFINIVDRPYTYHLLVTSSDMLSVLQKIQMVVVHAVMPLLRAISAVVTATFILIALLFVSPLVTVSLIGLVGGFYGLTILLIQPILRRNSRSIAHHQTERIRMVQEGIGVIRDVIVNGLQAQYAKRFDLVELDFRRRTALNIFLEQAPRYLIEMIVIVMLAAVTFLITDDGRDITDMLPVIGTFALGILRLFPLLQVIYRGQAQIAGATASIEDVLKLTSLDGLEPRRALPPPMPFRKKITFHEISYGYPQANIQALTNINIDIPKGSFVLIIGKTGSGKSTLVDLFMGLITPTQGALMVDGKQIPEASIPAWHGNIAHVPQSVFLIEASVAENITLGEENDDIDVARLEEAVRIAELTETINHLPDGLQTPVGERGANLSGGQRQRIGIARALYLNRPILVLDEATSALDTETERAVINNIRNSGTKTIISITHRPEVAAMADQILEVANGKATWRTS